MVEKYAVPDINPDTNLSMDYNNEFNLLYVKISPTAKNALDQIPKNSDLRKRFLLEYPTPKLMLYLERYPEDEYINPINNQNKENIETLDLIINKINKGLSSQNKDINFYKSLFEEAYKVVNGKDYKW